MRLWRSPRQTVRLPTGQKTKRAPPNRPLRLTPYAFAKLVYLRDLGPTEVGAFGICQRSDLLLVEDIVLVRQRCTEVTVSFDDAAVADFFDSQFDQGRHPEECGRIWIHTHPGSCPLPSSIDEATFERCFGQSDWAIMFILASGGRAYARLRFAAGPGGSVALPVEIDFGKAFAASDMADWKQEYGQRVLSEPRDCPKSEPTLLVPAPGSDSPHVREGGDYYSSLWPPERWFDERFL